MFRLVEENKIRINGARVLVKEIKLDNKIDSIVIPNREKEPTNKGIVLAVGDGALLENGTKVPVNIKVGETVIYSSFSGSPIKVKETDEEKYLILNERDILCIINED